MGVELIPIAGIPEVRPGDDLASLVAGAVRASGLTFRDGDVVVVTQKAVSKAEGRVVPEGPEGKAGWVARETRRVVARRGGLVVAETAHGFVCANAGVDASNVAPGFLTLLPEDPDRSAEAIRAGLEGAFGVRLGVVVSDTFGRPWREGVVNVAVGCAGLPALVDLRGTPDAVGQMLEATVVALADEVAAAAGLVMGKADRVPAAVVRGVRASGPPSPASALVRAPDRDLFRVSALEAVASWRPARGFGPGPVPRGSVEEAARAALRGAGPEAEGWRFALASSEAGRRRVLAALGPGEDGAALVAAPALVAAWAAVPGEVSDGSFPLRAGGVLRSFLLALHAQGLASRWAPASHPERARSSLGLAEGELAVAVVGVGRPAPGEEPVPVEPPGPPDVLLEVD